MFDLQLWLSALGVLLAFGFAGWLVSLVKQNVSIVDSMWPLMFLLAAFIYFSSAVAPPPRAGLVLLLVLLWSVRLAAHITWRNWGEGEDYRYRNIRENNAPNFPLKSIYIVFGLQAALAWFISLPLLAATTGEARLGAIDLLAVSVWVIGFFFEGIGDYQLAKFKADPANQGKVMDTGLWRYTRHPNYFGDFCVWWGFYLLAFAAGGWWSIASPILMSVLLLKVSGVAMLEKDITERRPKYSDYIRRTNAFLPGPAKQPESV